MAAPIFAALQEKCCKVWRNAGATILDHNFNVYSLLLLLDSQALLRDVSVDPNKETKAVIWLTSSTCHMVDFMPVLERAAGSKYNASSSQSSLGSIDWAGKVLFV